LYIVYLGERQHEDADHATASHHSILASVLGSEDAASESIVYSYKHGFSGFSAMLTEPHAEKIRGNNVCETCLTRKNFLTRNSSQFYTGLPGVISVRMNQMHSTHTTRSWDFMGLPYGQPNGFLASAGMGEDIIISVIDSG
jgi:hypothetical protein